MPTQNQATNHQHKLLSTTQIFMFALSLALVTSCYKVDKEVYSDETLQTSDGTEYFAHEIIIKKAPDVSMDILEAALEKLNAKIVDSDSSMAKKLGYIRVQLPQELLADAVISELMSEGLTQAAERNYIITLDAQPNDPMFLQSWHMATIEASKAWDVHTGSSEVIVAVTDTGIDFGHTDLINNIWNNPDEIPGNGIDDDENGLIDDVYGWDWVNKDNDPADDKGHGTCAAGIIGATGNNGFGVAGMNWNVKIMPLKFMSNTGNGSLWDAVEALLYAADKKAKVVNASWGCTGCDTSYFREAIAELENTGTMLVSSAGNNSHNVDNISYFPAAFGNSNVVSVAATDPSDGLASFSNYGKSKIHVAAPGTDILSTDYNNSYRAQNGTSFSAPIVAGLAALYWAHRPDASVEAVKERLISTSDPIAALQNKVVSGGRINAYKMMTDDDEPPPAPENLIVSPGNQNDADLTWTPVTVPDLAMYKIKWGIAPGQYAFELDVPSHQTNSTIEDLDSGTSHCFVVHAIDNTANMSPPSMERCITPGDDTEPPQVLDLSAKPIVGPKASGAVSAASSEASFYYQADNAYDGDPNTSWMAVPDENVNEEYVIVDFNIPFVIDRVVITPDAAYPEFFPVDFDIELAQNGADWVVVGGMRDVIIDDPSKKIDIFFPAMQASQIRITILKSQVHTSQYMYTGFAEFEAFQPSENSDSLVLSFTAPGDGPGIGKSDAYDIRYSTEPITESNFSLGTPVSYPLPSTSGVLEELIIDDLTAETAYWFAMKAVDESGNWSLMSNVAVTSTVVVLPGTINNLEVLYTDNNEALLTWNAPGNDGYEGQAVEYDLRWSEEPISAGNFEIATRVEDMPIPAPAGQNEVFDVTHLQHKHYHYFAIRAIDDKGHKGGISNVIAIKIEHEDKDRTAPATVNDLQAFSSLEKVIHPAQAIESSSHLQSQYTADQLLDGDVLTSWVTEELPIELPEWVIFDLGESQTISKFRMHPSIYGSMIPNFPQDFQIMVSADNVNWETVVFVEGQAASVGQWLEWGIPITSARFVKLNITLRGLASCNSPTECNQPSKIAISEFEVHGPTAEYDVDLLWVAPGDDGWEGFAYAYDLRHSNEEITEENFNSGEQVYLAAPLEGGRFEMRTVYDLNWGLEHYFAFKTVDESGNLSNMSNVAHIGAPINPPAPITDLIASAPTQTTVNLDWTATGDDGLLGVAVAYDLRYSKLPITSDNWYQATVLFGAPVPGSSGVHESFVATNLDPNSDYFFAFRVIDDEGGTSLLSNLAYAKTLTDIPPSSIEDLVAMAIDHDDSRPLAPMVSDSSGSYTQTSTAQMIIDENETSAWLSPRRELMQTEYIEFALDQPTLIGSINILPALGYEDMFPVNFSIQMRENSQDEWTTVISESHFYIDEQADWEQWSIGAVMAGEIRLEVTKTQPSSFGYFTAIGEIAFFENPSKFDTINLSWTAPSTADEPLAAAGYDIRVDDASISNISIFNKAATVSDPPTPKDAGMPQFHSVTGLEPETEYCFAIKATDTAGNESDLSNSPCTFTPGVPPATTIDLAVEATTTNTATITWSAPGDNGLTGQATNYDIRVYKKRINKTTWELATIAPITPTPAPAGTKETFLVTGLEGDTNYYFALRSYDSAGNESGISNNAHGTTGDDVPPLKISDLDAVTNFDEWGSLILSWTAPGDSGPIGMASGYDIRVSLIPITSLNFEGALPIPMPAPTPAASGTAESLILTGLNPEVNYYVAMRSLDDDGNYSAISNVPSARTRDEIPSAVEDLEVIETTSYELGDATVLLQWTAPGDDETVGTATEYEFRYSTDPITQENFEAANPAMVELIPAPGGTVQMVTINGLDEGLNYCFALRAIDDRENVGPVSNSTCGETADGISPSPIFDLEAETGPSRGTIRLTWTHPGDDGMNGMVSEYDLRWSYSPIDANNFSAATPTSTQPYPGMAGTGATFTAQELPDEEELHFAIKAVDDSANWSQLSNNAFARTLDVAPAAINDLAQTDTGVTSVTLSWTAPGDDEWVGTATAYDMRYSLSSINNNNFDDAIAVSIPAPQTTGSTETATIEGLLTGTTYYVAIKTVDERGNWSALSNYLSVGTADNVPPGQIDPLNVDTGYMPNMITLTWIATGDDGDVGTATLYEIRHAFECITEDNWDSAVEVSNNLSPRESGSSELFNVEGLEGETVYYFAIRAVDEAGNVGPISPCAFGDTMPQAPDAITDLEGEPVKPRSVILTWTAPFDPGPVGKAAAYDIHYSLYPITEENFAHCYVLDNPPIPGEAGALETATVPNLLESTLYYFAIKSIDHTGAVSAMSNVVEVETLDETPPDAPYDVTVGIPASGSVLVNALAASASSLLVDILGPENTIDGDDISMWVSDAASEPGEEWLALDLGEVAVIDRVRLLPNTEYIHLFPQNFTISVSEDGSEWYDVLAIEDFEAPSESWMTFGFDPQVAQFVKVTSYDPTLSYFGLYYTVISGMDVYGAASIAGRAKLNWTAPGDDGLVGTATYYELFYNKSPFDEKALDGISSTMALPVPEKSGTRQSSIIGGLTGEQRYYWAMRAVDEAGNIGALSEMVTAISEDAQPAIVTDLEATQTQMYEATFTWTATGDDGRSGTATSYEMRYAPWSLTIENFPFATEVTNMPTPLVAGTEQTVTVTGLEAGVAYRFAIVVYDEKGAASYLSNIAFADTIPEPDEIAPAKIADLAANTVNPGGDILGGTAIEWSSQQTPDYSADAVIDGDKSSAWSTVALTTSKEETVKVDLGSVYPIGEMKLWPDDEFINLFPPAVEIRVSVDNLQWFTVFSSDSHLVETSQSLDAAFPVTAVRYVEIAATELALNDNSYYYAVISEIEVIHAQSEPGTIVATWTATGDDGDEGQADQYNLRYSACPFNDAAATQVTVYDPKVQGEEELFRIEGLAAGTYCIGVSAIDESGNESPLSNTVEIYTPGSGG